MRARTVEAGLVLLLGAIAVWDGSRILILKWGKMGVAGGGGYVLLLGSFLAGLAVIHFLQGRVSGAGSAYKWGETHDLRRVGLAVLLAAGYVPAIQYLGYPLATAVFFVVYLRAFGSYRWLPILVSSFAGAVGAAYLWTHLGLTLPQGILPWP